MQQVTKSYCNMSPSLVEFYHKCMDIICCFYICLLFPHLSCALVRSLSFLSWWTPKPPSYLRASCSAPHLCTHYTTSLVIFLKSTQGLFSVFSNHKYNTSNSFLLGCNWALHKSKQEYAGHANHTPWFNTWNKKVEIKYLTNNFILTIIEILLFWITVLKKIHC